jgi:hypothetical protein
MHKYPTIRAAFPQLGMTVLGTTLATPNTTSFGPAIFAGKHIRDWTGNFDIITVIFSVSATDTLCRITGGGMSLSSIPRCELGFSQVDDVARNKHRGAQRDDDGPSADMSRTKRLHRQVINTAPGTQAILAQQHSRDATRLYNMSQTVEQGIFAIIAIGDCSKFRCRLVPDACTQT